MNHKKMILLLLSIVIFSSCTSNRKKNIQLNDTTGQTTALKKSNTKRATLVININNQTWASCLFLKADPSVHDSLSTDMDYNVDSISSGENVNNELNKIFTNENEDFFHLPRHIRLNVADSNKVINLNDLWVSSDYDTGGKIILQDVNFDGYQDLLLHNETNSGLTNRFYDIWIFNPKEKTYILWKTSLRLGLWGIDKRKKQLRLGIRESSVDNYIETWRMNQKDTSAKLILKETGYTKNKTEPYIKREELIKNRWIIVYDSDSYSYDKWKEKNKKELPR